MVSYCFTWPSQITIEALYHLLLATPPFNTSYLLISPISPLCLNNLFVLLASHSTTHLSNLQTFYSFFLKIYL